MNFEKNIKTVLKQVKKRIAISNIDYDNVHGNKNKNDSHNERNNKISKNFQKNI